MLQLNPFDGDESEQDYSLRDSPVLFCQRVIEPRITYFTLLQESSNQLVIQFINTGLEYMSNPQCPTGTGSYSIYVYMSGHSEATVLPHRVLVAVEESSRDSSTNSFMFDYFKINLLGLKFRPGFHPTSEQIVLLNMSLSLFPPP